MKLSFLSLAAFSLSGIPGFSRLAYGPLQQGVIAGRLLSVLRHKESARAIGRRYLGMKGGRPPLGKILEDLSPRRLWSLKSLNSMNDEELREAVEKAVKDDFRRGDVVKVDGWALSRTEAGLCALSVLF